MLRAHIDLNIKPSKFLRFNLGDFVGGVGKTLGLPEFGISEALGGSQPQLNYNTNYTSPSGAQGNTITDWAAGNQSQLPITQYSQAAGPPAPATSGGGGTPSNSNVQIPSANTDAQSAIDALYNQTLSDLGNRQGEFQTANTNTINELNAAQTSGTNQINQYGEQRQGAIENTRQSQARNQGSSLEQLRQLFSDLGRQGQSQAAAGGYSSSSANDAMQAILGREMGGRVGDVLAKTGDVYRALDQESKQVKTFVGDQTLQLQQDTQNKINEANSVLQQGLNQLSALRGQAAVGKQQQKADLFQSYQNQVLQIQAANQQAVNQLALWSHGVNTNLQSAQQLHSQTNPQTQAMNLQPNSYGANYNLPQQQSTTQGFQNQLSGSRAQSTNDQQFGVPQFATG